MANINLKDKNLQMTSVELTQKINEFRKEECELNSEKKFKELRHDHFMAKIKKELEMLELLGLSNVPNFWVVEYVDKKGETRPCYQLNREGIGQMLNSESVYVRFKTMEYIKELEDSRDRHRDVALSEGTLVERTEETIYNDNLDMFKFSALGDTLINSTYKTIEDNVINGFYFHANKPNKGGIRAEHKWDAHKGEDYKGVNYIEHIGEYMILKLKEGQASKPMDFDYVRIADRMMHWIEHEIRIRKNMSSGRKEKNQDRRVAELEQDNDRLVERCVALKMENVELKAQLNN